MSEGPEYDERRQHQRIPVSSGIIAVLITSCPEIIGSVSDISLGGAKITYHKPENIDFDCTRIELRVDFISDDRFVEAIPCTNAWDRPVRTTDVLAAEDLRQCGIKFEDLTPNQLFLLRGFINRYAPSGHAAQLSGEVPSSITQ